MQGKLPQDPLRSALPDPLERVLDVFFPPDEVLPGPGTGVLSGPSRGLIRALRPMTSQAIQKSELASHLLKRLMTGEPPPVDMAKLAAMEKVTGARPPMSGSIKAPEGFAFKSDSSITKFRGKRPNVIARDPEIDRLSTIFDKFFASQPDTTKAGGSLAKPIKSVTSGERPPLSGRWNANKVGAAQGQKLAAQARKNTIDKK